MRLGAVLAEAIGRNAIGSTASGSAECGEVVEKKNRCRETGERPELDGPATGRVTSFQAEGARTQTRLGLPRLGGPRLLGALPRTPARCAEQCHPVIAPRKKEIVIDRAKLSPGGDRLPGSRLRLEDLLTRDIFGAP